jgi:hypothetical protein
MMPAHVALSLVSIACQYDYATGIKSMDHVESLSRAKFHMPRIPPIQFSFRYRHRNPPVDGKPPQARQK